MHDGWTTQAAAAGRPRPRTTVLLAGFEQLFARALYGALRESALVEVVQANPRAPEIEAALAAHRPRAVLLCWETIDALELRRLTRAHQESAFVVVAHSVSGPQTRALTRCGAAAVLERGVSRSLMVATAIVASHGQQVEPRDRCADARLSAREVEVLGLLECGESVPAIARVLDVSVDTVKSQARAVYRKLGISSRAELRARRVMTSLGA